MNDAFAQLSPEARNVVQAMHPRPLLAAALKGEPWGKVSQTAVKKAKRALDASISQNRECKHRSAAYRYAEGRFNANKGVWSGSRFYVRAGRAKEKAHKAIDQLFAEGEAVLEARG